MDSIKKTDKGFLELKEKIALIEKFHNKIDCSYVQNIGLNQFKMEIVDKKFDSNRNLYVIYDPHTEF